jgi:hypothetical protein
VSNIEVDQSGRMEMSGDTTIGASDGFTVTVRITAKLKHEVREMLRKRRVKTRLIMIRMFAAAILLAIQEHLTEVESLTIDEEYTGYEAEIKSLLINKMRAWGMSSAGDDIRVARIGKKSPAHRAAIQVTRRQARADKTPTTQELLGVC